MFTGIVEEVGTIHTIRPQGRTVTLSIAARDVLHNLKVDDSVCVNGVCLTAKSFSKRAFVVDVVEATLKKTSIGALRSGSKVNLERAMRLSDRLGGHLMQGHVDCAAPVVRAMSQAGNVLLSVRLPLDKMKYVISEGSIAIDGVSLTVAGRDASEITVALIPHTLMKTTLSERKIGDIVNIEVDMIGKYVESILASRKPEGVRDWTDNLRKE